MDKVAFTADERTIGALGGVLRRAVADALAWAAGVDSELPGLLAP
jgi:hypothetical protein